MTATVVPALDFNPEFFIHPKTGESMSATIIAFSVDGAKATPVRWPEVPRAFEPVRVGSGFYTHGAASAHSLQELARQIKEGAQ